MSLSLFSSFALVSILEQDLQGVMTCSFELKGSYFSFFTIHDIETIT